MYTDTHKARNWSILTRIRPRVKSCRRIPARAAVVIKPMVKGEGCMAHLPLEYLDGREVRLLLSGAGFSWYEVVRSWLSWVYR